MFRCLFILAVLSAATGAACAAPGTSDTPFPRVSGPYLGQEPPGREPELFAPGIMPTGGVQHCAPAFAPDGREVYWLEVDTSAVRPKGTIWRMREIDGFWHPPEVAPFSGEYNDHAPVFSQDGRRIYFASSRPGGIEGCRSIWYVERSDTSLSDPVFLGSPPNTEACATQPTFCQDGTVYFVGRYSEGQWGVGIYRSRLVDGEYQPPALLGPAINTKYADSYPFIAPDEGYLLFGSSRPGAASVETDLFISRRSEDGDFEEPVHLDESINNGMVVSFSCVTHDGKYLFFRRFDGASEDATDLYYWVDAKVLEPYISKLKMR